MEAHLTTASGLSAQAQLAEWRGNPVKFVWDSFKVDADVWQREALNAFASADRDKQRITLRACAGPGKAQPHDMIIPTPTGMRRFGDLKVGEYVIGDNGAAAKVVGIADWGMMDAYRVEFSDGTSTEACGEHLWKVNDPRKSGWKVMSTKSILDIISSKTRSYFEIPRQGKSLFRPKRRRRNLVIDPYVLGVWLGDGSRKKGNFTTKDNEIIEQVKSRGYETKQSKMNITVYKILGHLRNLGILDNYSYEKSIPEVYKFSSIEQRIDLLRGLMDTDGCVDAEDASCEYGTTSKRLAEDVVFLVRSLGGVAKIKKTIKKTGYKKNGVFIPCRDCYRVSVTTDFDPFFLNRKSERWRPKTERYLKRYIRSITPIGKKEVRCIEVSNKSHCYLANDFIVTHNSAVLAWCGWNFLSCYGTDREHPKAAAISISADNLKDNLWAEFSKWQSASKFLSDNFTWTKERIFMNTAPATWFISARGFSKTANSEEQGRTLSGLHSKYVLYLIDESGDISPQVLKSADQGLSTGPVFGKIMQAGNPTSHAGMLYAAATTLAHMWHQIIITGDPDDPRRSKRIDIEWARDQIKTYGRDNPWVMAFILGLFPPGSLNTLLGPDEVEAAMRRQPADQDYLTAQKRLGVDVARFGADSTILFPRQGLVAFKPVEMRNARSNEIAARVMLAKATWKSEIEFLDDTGGWASGVVDSLLQAGQSPVPVNFAGKPDSDKYLNLRAEMWFRMAEWIKRGGCLPNDSQLVKELTAPTYYFQNGKFQLEPKEQIKSRLGFSPDRADSLALTFRYPEMPAGIQAEMARLVPGYQSQALKHDYDPFA